MTTGRRYIGQSHCPGLEGPPGVRYRETETFCNHEYPRAVGVKAAAAPLSPMSPDILTSTSPTNTGPSLSVCSTSLLGAPSV